MKVYNKKDQIVIEALEDLVKKYPAGIWVTGPFLKEHYSDVAKLGYKTINTGLLKLLDFKSKRLSFVVLDKQKIVSESSHQQINRFFVISREQPVSVVSQEANAA